MQPDSHETLYFRYCRNAAGELMPIDTARRNHRLVPCFCPADFAPELRDQRTDYAELVEEVSENLTKIERKTWIRLLDGFSINDIAEADRVSRAAVYARIRGRSKAIGGMVAKNAYVEIWWRRRQGSLR